MKYIIIIIKYINNKIGLLFSILKIIKWLMIISENKYYRVAMLS